MYRATYTLNGRCTLTIETTDDGGPCYVMSGPSGRHVLPVAHTPADRLLAHWRGFVENNGGEFTAPMLSRTAWNGARVVFRCTVLAERDGRYLVASRVWKYSDKVRLVLAVDDGRRGTLRRVRMWTRGNAPRWVREAVRGTRFADLA